MLADKNRNLWPHSMIIHQQASGDLAQGLPSVKTMVSAMLAIPATSCQWTSPNAPLYTVISVRRQWRRWALTLAVGSQRYETVIEGDIQEEKQAMVGRGDRIVIVGRSHPAQGIIRIEDIRKILR